MSTPIPETTTLKTVILGTSNVIQLLVCICLIVTGASAAGFWGWTNIWIGLAGIVATGIAAGLTLFPFIKQIKSLAEQT